MTAILKITSWVCLLAGVVLLICWEPFQHEAGALLTFIPFSNLVLIALNRKQEGAGNPPAEI